MPPGPLERPPFPSHGTPGLLEPGPSGPLCHGSPGLRRRPREAPTPRRGSAPGRTSVSPASPERQQGCSPGPGPRGCASINAPWHYPAPSAPRDGAATPGSSVCVGLRLRPCPALLHGCVVCGPFPANEAWLRGLCSFPPAAAPSWSCRLDVLQDAGGVAKRGWELQGTEPRSAPRAPTEVFHRKAKLSSFTEVKKKRFNITEVDGNVGTGRLWVPHPGVLPLSPLNPARPSAPLQPGCVHLPPSAPGAPGAVGVAVGVLAADAHPSHALLQARLLCALHESINLQRGVWSQLGDGRRDHWRRWRRSA